jgi:hypothetical protein
MKETKMKARKIVVAIMFLVALMCNLVFDDGGISTEKDVMIYDAIENTTP